jgi:hypothetical protein
MPLLEGRMVRRAWQVSWIAWVVSVAALVSVRHLESTGIDHDVLPLTQARDLLFTRVVSDSGYFNETPAELVRGGFRFDRDVDVTSFRDSLRRDTGLSDTLVSISQIAGSPERARALVNVFSSADRAGGCGRLLDMRDKLAWIREGHGCCSDHTDVFIALAEVVGLPAREVRSANHAVVEVFDQERRRWFFVDPLFAVMATREGVYVPVRDLADSSSRSSIVFDFFGGVAHPHSPENRLFHGLYANPGYFHSLRITAGSNVLAQYADQPMLKAVPKSVFEFVQHLSGTRPGFVQVIPLGSSFGRQLSRTVAWALLGVLAGACALGPAVTIGRTFQERLGATDATLHNRSLPSTRSAIETD